VEHRLAVRYAACQGTPVVYFVTRQVTGCGAVLCSLAELSKSAPGGIPQAATVCSASTHEAEDGEQWHKQKDWV